MTRPAAPYTEGRVVSMHAVAQGYPERSGPSTLSALMDAVQPIFHVLAPPFPDDMIIRFDRRMIQECDSSRN